MLTHRKCYCRCTFGSCRFPESLYWSWAYGTVPAHWFSNSDWAGLYVVAPITYTAARVIPPGGSGCAAPAPGVANFLLRLQCPCASLSSYQGMMRFRTSGGSGVDPGALSLPASGPPNLALTTTGVGACIPSGSIGLASLMSLVSCSPFVMRFTLDVPDPATTSGFVKVTGTLTE